MRKDCSSDENTSSLKTVWSEIGGKTDWVPAREMFLLLEIQMDKLHFGKKEKRTDSLKHGKLKETFLKFCLIGNKIFKIQQTPNPLNHFFNTSKKLIFLLIEALKTNMQW